MIDILRVDEDGRTIAEFEDADVLKELLAGQSSLTGCCLRFLDPYGDTTFNQLQIPVLVDELRSIVVEVPPALRARANALVAFIESARGEVHTYIKFMGD